MTVANTPPLDLLAIGEIVIDFIATQLDVSLAQSDTFNRYQGGSPANIAVNVAKLGGKTALAAKVGADPFGQFLTHSLQSQNVSTAYLSTAKTHQTSLIFVSRSQNTPEFYPIRSADYHLTPANIPDEAIARAKIIHASTFALSREPCRSAIVKTFEKASAQGKIISLDPNYSPLVWPNKTEAQNVIRHLYQYTTLTKASLDDMNRLFTPSLSPEAYLDLLHSLGPETVILTLGKNGSLLSHKGQLISHLPARPINVSDVTGAGDSFLAGFLVALLDEHPLETCLLFAREIVEMKLQTVGPLPMTVDKEKIYHHISKLSI